MEGSAPGANPAETGRRLHYQNQYRQTARLPILWELLGFGRQMLSGPGTVEIEASGRKSIFRQSGLVIL